MAAYHIAETHSTVNVQGYENQWTEDALRKHVRLRPVTPPSQLSPSPIRGDASCPLGVVMYGPCSGRLRVHAVAEFEIASTRRL